MRLDGSLKGLGVGANDLGDPLAVLEEDEGRHGADGELLGDLGDFVNVELVEARVGVGVGEPARLLVSILLLAGLFFLGYWLSLLT